MLLQRLPDVFSQMQGCSYQFRCRCDNDTLSLLGCALAKAGNQRFKKIEKPTLRRAHSMLLLPGHAGYDEVCGQGER